MTRDDQSSEDEDDLGHSGDEEAEEWSGLQQANSGAHQPDERTGTKPKKPPTGEELRNIKDATDLYRSSSFKLQVRVHMSEIAVYKAE